MPEALLLVSLHACSEMLWHWAGVDDRRVIELAAPPTASILRDTPIEYADSVDAVAAHLRMPAAERRRRAPLRPVLRRFSETHHRFGTALLLAVRLAARSGK
jgi:hypothetical protein